MLEPSFLVRPTRTQRTLLVAGAVALGLIVLVWSLVPPIGSRLAPRILERAFAREFRGSARVGRVALGWGSPTTIESIEILDDRGLRVGKIRTSIPTGAWGLVGRSRDLRTIRLRAEVAIVETVDAGGRRSSNLARALAPRSGRTRWKLPRGYRVALELEPSSIRYTEVGSDGRALSTAAITGLTGSGELDTRAASGSVAGSLKGAVSSGTGAHAGAIELAVRVTDLTDVRGEVRRDARADIRLRATSSPVRLVDAMLGLDGLALDALGDRADVTLAARGTRSSATFRLAISSSGTRADLAFDVGGGRLTAARPSSIHLASTAFLARTLRIRDRLARAGITVEQAPSLDVTIRSLAMPLDSAADLRGAATDLEAHTGPARLTARSPSGDGTLHTMAVAPGTVRLRSTDLAGELELSGNLGAIADRRPGGAIEADLVFANLLDGAGHWRRDLPGSMRGSVVARDLDAGWLALALAETRVPIDPHVDVGATLDATFTAREVAARADPAAISTDIDVTVRSTNLRLQSSWRLGRHRLETRAGGFDARFAQTSPLLRRILAGRKASAILTGPGSLQIVSPRLVIPLAKGRPSATAEGLLRLGYADASLAAAARHGEREAATLPVRIDHLTATVTLAAGRSLHVFLDGGLSQRARRLTASGDLAIDGLSGEKRPDRIGGLGTTRLSGTVAFRDLPPTLAEAFGIPAGDGLAGFTGERVTAVFELQGSTAGQRVSVRATSPVLAADAAFQLGESLEILGVEATSTMSAASVRTLLAAVGMDPDSMRDLRLSAPSRLTARIRPVTIPLAAGTLSPEIRRGTIRAITASAVLDPPLIVENLRLGQATLHLGLSGVEATASVPVTAPGARGTRAVPITGTIQGRLVRITAQREVPVATFAGDVSLVPGGPLGARLAWTGIRSSLVDAMLGHPGLVSGALGEPAAVVLTATRSGGTVPTRVVLDLESPQLVARRWQLESDTGVARVIGPATAEWKVPPEWANRYGLRPGASTKSARMGVVGTTAARIRFDRLSISLPRVRSGGVRGPFEPGVFAIDASVSAPRVDLAWREEQRRGSFQPVAVAESPARSAPTFVPHTAVLQAISLSAMSRPDRTIALLASIAQVYDRTSDLPGHARASLVLSNLGDSTGRFGHPSVTGRIEAHSFPTALVDGLSAQHGVLRECLGPTMDVTAQLTGIGARTGTLSAAVDSARATLTIAGRIRDGALAVARPPASSGGPPALRVQLLEMSETLGRELMRPLFTVSSVYKRREDGPGLVTSDDLELPMDEDLRKLNGTLHVDLGTARFVVNSDLFSGLLRAFGQSGGPIGRRVEPFDVSIAAGVARFHQVQVPLGEFTCRSSGTIDLVHDTLDVLVWIPATQVTDESLGALNVGVGGMVNRILPPQITHETMIPFRVRGRISDPGKPQPDPGLFLERFGSNLLRTPGKLLDALPVRDPSKRK